MKKRTDIVEVAMKNRQILLLLTVLLAFFGIYALQHMPRKEFPVVTIRQGLVIGLYPGAAPAIVEEQLTNPAEEYLFSYKEIKRNKTWSVSRNGLMVIFVELSDRVTDADEFWSKLNHGLQLFKLDLPAGVAAVYTNSEFGETSALLISLEAEHQGYRELEIWLGKLEQRLRALPDMSRIQHFGLQKEQISVYLETEKLSSYGISSPVLTASLFSQGLTTAGGSINDGKQVIPIHIAESYNGEENLGRQIIYADPLGNMIRLRDVATIVREYPKPESYIKNNGYRSLLLSMEMTPGRNIVQFGKEVDQVLEKFRQELPPGIAIRRIADQPKVVGDSVSTFLHEFLSAIAAVILVTMLLLPFRAAAVSASSIPITVFISLGIMYLTGIELNTVTLAALIVVLGMIVDNSVVIVDSYMDLLDRGLSPWQAAINSANGFFRAIFSATLAISITFFPFLFTLDSTFKDFVLLFPWTVTISLGISLLVAMLVIPYLQYFFIRHGFHPAGPDIRKRRVSLLDMMQRRYNHLLERAFRYPAIIIGAGIGTVAAGVVLLGLIPQRLMPVAERDQFAVEISLNQGSALQETARVADSLEKLLKSDPRVVSVTSFIGTSSPRFHTTYAPKLPATHYAQFIVNTTSIRATEELLDQYSSRYSGYFPNAYVRFRQLDYQPVAAPVEIRLSGSELPAMMQAADTIQERLRKVPGLTGIRTDFEGQLPGLMVIPDETESNRLGINRSVMAANLAMAYGGFPVTTIWEGDYPLKVFLRTERAGTEIPGELGQEYIHSIVPGVSVPLRQVATVEPYWNPGQIVRRNGIRTLTVMADVARGINVNDIFPAIRETTRNATLPADVTVAYGGAFESDRETIPGIINGFVMSITIIFLILLFHFRRINLSLLVLGSSLLTLPGATLGCLMLGVDFGITSILGIVSVIGILVRNGIIMLDYAEELRHRKGFGVREAAMEAGKRRMRPIFLTSAAASVGVVPMIVSRSALWAPMGTVICFGTILAMVLVLFILPVTYWLIFRRADEKKVESAGNNTHTIFKSSIAILATLLIVIVPALRAQQPLSLEACKASAMQYNTRIRNAALEVGISREIRREAFTHYFPQLEGNWMTFRAAGPLVDATITGGNLPVYDGIPAHLTSTTQFAWFPGFNVSFLERGYLGMITAVQPLFAGGRIVYGNRLAELGVAASSSQEILVRNDLLLKVEEQYWQVAALQAKLQTLVMVAGLLDSLEKQAADAVKAGLINRNEIMKVRLKQSELRVSRLQLENGIRLATMALCQTAGIVWDSTLMASDTLPVLLPPSTIRTDACEALGSREESRLLDSRIRAEEYQTRLKMGEYLPQIGVGAASYMTNFIGDETNNSLAFATVRVPVSDWWGASHKIRQQQLREEIARNEKQEKSDLMILQIRQVWYNLVETWQQLTVAQETIGQAEENLRLNRDNYEAGLVVVSDMLEAQTMLQQVKDQFTELQVKYRNNWNRYLQVTGRFGYLRP